MFIKCRSQQNNSGGKLVLQEENVHIVFLSVF